METPVKERLKSFIKSQGLSVRAFETSIGVAYGYVANMSKGIGNEKLSLICNTYPSLNRDWLLFGEGDMMLPDTEESLPTITAEPSGNAKPYYDVDFIGGFSEVFNDQTTVPASMIAIRGYEQVDVWCNVTGHSMEPQISHGDIIGLRKCTIDDIQYGETYAVVLDNIRTVKILRKATSDDMIRFVPINTESYDEQEFKRSRIQSVFEVVAAIKRFF